MEESAPVVNIDSDGAMESVGVAVGIVDGAKLGDRLGLSVGFTEVDGGDVGNRDGECVGIDDGALVGPGEGRGDIVGDRVGDRVGVIVGYFVGVADGMSVGESVGESDGAHVPFLSQLFLSSCLRTSCRCRFIGTYISTTLLFSLAPRIPTFTFCSSCSIGATWCASTVCM